MLKINPDAVLRYSKLISEKIDEMEGNIQKSISINNSISNKKYNLNSINKRFNLIKDGVHSVDKIVQEIEEITDLTREELLSGHFENDYYEDKMLKYYAKKMCTNNVKNTKAYFEELGKYYDTSNDNGKFSSYYQRQNFINNYRSLLKDFNPKTYGLTDEKLEKDIIYIYDTRGSSEAYGVVNALANNAPKNYLDYHFNTTEQLRENRYYDYNGSIKNYQTNSELIKVNGYEYEIAQVLPKDCTETEKLAYNFCKANVVNTMRTLPDNYLKNGVLGNSNSIVLTSNVEVMNNGGKWGGYYKESSFFSKSNNMIVIDAHGSFIDNEYYTQDVLIHEMGHKFDDMMNPKNFFDYLLGRNYYTDNSKEWKDVYNKYQNVLCGINNNGYANYPNVNEFFGDVSVAYFKNPNTLKKLCPEAYDLFSSMLGGEYGYSYNVKIKDVVITKLNY